MANIEQHIFLAQQNQELIELDHFVDHDTFTVGYVAHQDDEFVMLKTIDPDGKINGVIVIRISDIYAARRKTDYLRTVAIKEKLAKHQGYYDAWEIEWFFNEYQPTTASMMANLVDTALRNKEVITIGWVDEDRKDAHVTGFLVDVHEGLMTFIYADDRDLSDLWTIQVRVEQIDYLRMFSFHTFGYQAILANVFHEEF